MVPRMCPHCRPHMLRRDQNYFQGQTQVVTSSSSRSPGPGSPGVRIFETLCGAWWVTDLSGLQFRDQENKRLRLAEGFEHYFSDPRIPWRT